VVQQQTCDCYHQVVAYVTSHFNSSQLLNSKCKEMAAAESRLSRIQFLQYRNLKKNDAVVCLAESVGLVGTFW